MKHLTKTLALLLVALLLLPGCVSQYANKVDKEPTAAPATEAPAPTEEPAPTEAPAQQAEATAEPEPEPTETPAPTEAPVAREKQTLQVWYAVSGTSGEKFTALSKEFDDQSDLVDLELSYSGGSADTATKVSAALLTNTQPDVALMYAGPLYTGGRNDYAMEELMKREGFGMDDIFPGMLDYCTYMGQGICAVPFGISTQVMYYNKTLLEKAGVDMTNPPKTWQEFYDLCADLLTKVEGDDFTAFDVSDAPWLFKSMLKQNGCEIVVQGEDGKIQPVYNNEAALEVTDFWYSLVTSGIMAAGPVRQLRLHRRHLQPHLPLAGGHGVRAGRHRDALLQDPVPGPGRQRHGHPHRRSPEGGGGLGVHQLSHQRGEERRVRPGHRVSAHPQVRAR